MLSYADGGDAVLGREDLKTTSHYEGQLSVKVLDVKMSKTKSAAFVEGITTSFPLSLVAVSQ